MYTAADVPHEARVIWPWSVKAPAKGVEKTSKCNPPNFVIDLITIKYRSSIADTNTNTNTFNL